MSDTDTVGLYKSLYPSELRVSLQKILPFEPLGAVGKAQILESELPGLCLASVNYYL